MTFCVEKLQQTNELIHQLMYEKRRLLANIMHINEDDYDTVAEVGFDVEIRVVFDL